MPDAPRTPLAVPHDRWRSRWLVVGDGFNMHRVAIIEWDDGQEMIAGRGVAVCGAQGRMHMPGVLSRMGARRCPLCCDALGIPRGAGAPGNAAEEWHDA
jgi:hypothetical protein